VLFPVEEVGGDVGAGEDGDGDAAGEWREAGMPRPGGAKVNPKPLLLPADVFPKIGDVSGEVEDKPPAPLPVESDPLNGKS
jgi:hypothetical protein